MGIISETAKVKVSPKTINYYKELGYKIDRMGDEIIVKVEDLTKSSHVKVQVACDRCNKKRDIIYRDYVNTLNTNGHYYCMSCSHMGINAGISRKGVGRKKGYKRSKETKEKFVATMKERYGVENPAQLPDTLIKAAQTYYKNSSKECSKQQLYIYYLYNMTNSVKLNYPISYYNVDIYLTDEKLVCEYDGGGHNLRVALGQLTQKEFDQKEIVRNNIIKREGYKQMRIISSKDLLPSDSILLQMLEYTKEYFSNYPEHSWIEFNIDTSIVQNAEQKDGVFFNYGELRRIKDLDLSGYIA